MDEFEKMETELKEAITAVAAANAKLIELAEKAVKQYSIEEHCFTHEQLSCMLDEAKRIGYWDENHGTYRGTLWDVRDRLWEARLALKEEIADVQ